MGAGISNMRRLQFLRLVLFGALALRASAQIPARRKLEAIDKGQVASGETVRFSRQELLEYAREELSRNKVRGVRSPNFLLGANHATGSAHVDFHLLQGSVRGRPPGILSRLLLSGERYLEVELRLSSERGWCRIDLLSVEVDGWDINGKALEWLIQNYVMQRYPNAKINTWFQLENNIKQVALTPAELRVLIA